MTHPYNLAELCYMTLREVGGNVLQDGTATGGSTSTIVDSSRTEEDDYWNGGTAFIIETTDGLAPQWEMKEISDFANASGTITLKSTVSASVAAGDIYAIAKKRYPLYAVRQWVNNALVRIGPVPFWDEATLTISAGVTEYSLPRVARYDLREVYIQGDTETADFNWVKAQNWRIEPGAIEAVSTLIFDREYEAGMKIGLAYNAPHPQLLDDADTLHEDIPVMLVVYQAALGLFKFYRDKTRTNDFRERINELEKLVNDMSAQYKVPTPPRGSKILISR